MDTTLSHDATRSWCSWKSKDNVKTYTASLVPVCCPHELWMMKEWINYWRMIEFHIGVNHWRTITRVVSSAIKPLSGSKYHYLSQQAKITPDCIREKIRRPFRPIAMLELKWDGSGCWGCIERVLKRPVGTNLFFLCFAVLPSRIFTAHCTHGVCTHSHTWQGHSPTDTHSTAWWHLSTLRRC